MKYCHPLVGIVLLCVGFGLGYFHYKAISPQQQVVETPEEVTVGDYYRILKFLYIPQLNKYVNEEASLDGKVDVDELEHMRSLKASYEEEQSKQRLKRHRKEFWKQVDEIKLPKYTTEEKAKILKQQGYGPEYIEKHKHDEIIP